ncbi:MULTISPECIES: SWIM zinc finger family protein [unclassified Nocardiopsis]|uniref:SWIM zinc finger family protein n=1 Tax=unclassified Nocardiopsis TaxID=2649073 RepID=UPI0033F086C7
MSWAELVRDALGLTGGGGGAVERLTVGPGEVGARTRGHEVSLIRTVWPDREWERAGAALASQPLFRARVLSGELPGAVARVFALLGLDLVPDGWGDLVATCSCDHWQGRCAHVLAVADALAAEADRDPFALARWAGRERRALVELVRSSPTGSPAPSSEGTEFTGGGAEDHSRERWETGNDVFAAQAQTASPLSPAGFWAFPVMPAPPALPDGAGDRVRAAAPGHVADHLPGFDRSAKGRSETGEGL